ncbi:4'-phosphopantetheinyl transferase superfamily protein [Pedobacter immunditicola]|uniref:4'-phosphopantetheinyl transferase superfamily protein n=1 Tax=Pedobacter immunditicola TaxID=3133440 RepID=UPI0030A4FCDA
MRLLKPNYWKLIGNDIVDLLVAAQESNWKRKGFLKKIFTAEEQLLIMSSQQPEATLWLLWSMKEAAYKIYSREKGIRCFAPTSLCCQLAPLLSNNDEGERTYTGKVLIGDDIYLTQSTGNVQLIHTICATNETDITQIKINIFTTGHPLFNNYKHTKPGCVSHHGSYLALVYLGSGSPQSVN